MVLARIKKLLEGTIDVRAAQFVDVVDLDDSTGCLPVFVSFCSICHARPDFALAIVEDDTFLRPFLFLLALSLPSMLGSGELLGVVVHPAVNPFPSILIEEPGLK